MKRLSAHRKLLELIDDSTIIDDNGSIVDSAVISSEQLKDEIHALADKLIHSSPGRTYSEGFDDGEAFTLFRVLLILQKYK